MNDVSYRKLKSRDGKPLTDSFLHENLDKYYPGLGHAYQTTSSYVHLSASHIKHGLVENPETPILLFHLKGTDEAQPYESFADTIDWFDQATELTANMIEDFMRYRYLPNFGKQPA